MIHAPDGSGRPPGSPVGGVRMPEHSSCRGPLTVSPDNSENRQTPEDSTNPSHCLPPDSVRIALGESISASPVNTDGSPTHCPDWGI